MRLISWLLAALLFTTPALAQTTLLQAGPVVSGHVPIYASNSSTQAVVSDSGTAAGGAAGTGLKELGITVRSTGTAPFADAGTGPNGENFCNYDGPTTGEYHYICLSPNAQGGALISAGAEGGADELPLQFMVNGEIVTQATTGTYTSGAVLCFDTVSQSIIACPNTSGTGNVAYTTSPVFTTPTLTTPTITGGTLTGSTLVSAVVTSLSAPLAVAQGGTAVTSYGALSTAMGLGTMSTQNASAVNITGATQITGLPSPSASTDAATKGYVDTVASTGLIPLAASRLATATTLPANTYANGASGVGATLTGNSNGALSVDGVAVASSNVILVKDEAAPANNGIYTVTVAGSGGAAYVLTRATYFDTAAEMLKNSYTAVTAGNTNVGSSWVLATTVATVGSSAVTFNLFTSSALNSLPSAQIFVGNSSNVATPVAMSQDCAMANTGAITCTKTNNVSFAASATTDTTVATNISSGTLPAARLPNPSASTLGGVQSYVAVSNQFLTSISTAGVPVSAQPSFNNLSGTAGVAQGGTGISSYTIGDLPYASATTTIAKLPIGTTGQVLTVVGGLPAWGSNASGTDQQTFLASGTWTKPGTANLVNVQCWGGGASGGRDSGGDAGGGGGGAYVARMFNAADLGGTETVTIGAGGAARSTNTDGAAGGNSTFGSHLTAYGGGGGSGVGSGASAGGGGAGTGSVGQSVTSSTGGTGGTPFITDVTAAGTGGIGGTGGSVITGGTGYWGGGGGGAGSNGGTAGAGGAGTWGGGGGGGAGFSGGNGAGGVSTYGGEGSAGNRTSSASAGSQPAGGGGASRSGNSGAGGDGQCIVTTW